MKYYIETYGCTANFANSADLDRALREMGHLPSSLEEADAVIVNTCAVIAKTQRKILRRLEILQGKRLLVGGCLAVAHPKSISGIECRDRLGLLSASIAAKVAGHHPPEPQGPRPVHAPQSRDLCAAIVISEGCNGSCSYCIVRKARGRLVSRPVEEIIAGIERAVAEGAAEVQISAQDAASYGLDLGTTLARLLDEASRIPGSFMVRIGMMNPAGILSQQKELIRAFKSPRIYSFLHVPVQSGSDDVLRRMGRDYRAMDFLAAVDAFRQELPDITTVTDVIVGFPGETEDDFLRTQRLIERLQPDKVNVTRFSLRPGTKAEAFYDMPERIKKDRSREITRMWQEIAASKNQRHLGKVLSAVVVEEGQNGTMKARTQNYLEVVVKERVPLGSRVRVEISEYNSFYVSGRPVSLDARSITP